MKILVVGLGSIGQRHVRNLRTLAGSAVDLVAYRVRKYVPVITERMAIEAGSDVEQRYGIRSYGTLEEALAERPDAVLVCNPTRHHIPVALAAARAGCHLLIEKPLSDRYDEVEDLIAEVEARKLVALVGYQMRFHPALLKLRAILERRALGRLRSVEVHFGEYLPSAHPYEDYRCSYAARADLGGGVVLCHSHELDYVYWLFGAPVRLRATGGHLSDLEMDVEDTADIDLEYLVDGHPLGVHLSLDFLQRPSRRSCEIVGDGGRIHVDFQALTFEMMNDRGEPVLRESFDGFERNQLFLDEMSRFLACMEGRDAPPVTLHDGAQSLRMAVAARRSLMTGTTVELS